MQPAQASEFAVTEEDSVKTRAAPSRIPASFFIVFTSLFTIYSLYSIYSLYRKSTLFVDRCLSFYQKIADRVFSHKSKPLPNWERPCRTRCYGVVPIILFSSSTSVTEFVLPKEYGVRQFDRYRERDHDHPRFFASWKAFADFDSWIIGFDNPSMSGFACTMHTYSKSAASCARTLRSPFSKRI